MLWFREGLRNVRIGSIAPMLLTAHSHLPGKEAAPGSPRAPVMADARIEGWTMAARVQMAILVETAAGKFRIVQSYSLALTANT